MNGNGIRNKKNHIMSIEDITFNQFCLGVLWSFFHHIFVRLKVIRLAHRWKNEDERYTCYFMRASFSIL